MEKRDETDGSIFFLPRAPNDPNIQRSTTEYSLMINSLSLKYLDDDQLTHVARTSPQQQNISLEQENYSRYGLPENNVSVATKEFLSNNRLTKSTLYRQ